MNFAAVKPADALLLPRPEVNPLAHEGGFLPSQRQATLQPVSHTSRLIHHPARRGLRHDYQRR